MFRRSGLLTNKSWSPTNRETNRDFSEKIQTFTWRVRPRPTEWARITGIYPRGRVGVSETGFKTFPNLRLQRQDWGWFCRLDPTFYWVPLIILYRPTKTFTYLSSGNRDSKDWRQPGPESIRYDYPCHLRNRQSEEPTSERTSDPDYR